MTVLFNSKAGPIKISQKKISSNYRNNRDDLSRMRVISTVVVSVLIGSLLKRADMMNFQPTQKLSTTRYPEKNSSISL